jgi:hypothetical protein
LRANNQGFAMRHLKVPLLLAFALLTMPENVQAQTGEFVATVPGSVVHAGYGLQDWLQDMRNGKYEPPPALGAVQDPVIIVPPPREPAPAKPRKTAKKVATTSQVQPKQ